MIALPHHIRVRVKRCNLIYVHTIFITKRIAHLPHILPMASSPSRGPGNNSHEIEVCNAPQDSVANSMETIVMAKPMLFIMASAPPTLSGGQACVAKAENWGESATTNNPHTTNSDSATPGSDPDTHG